MHRLERREWVRAQQTQAYYIDTALNSEIVCGGGQADHRTLQLISVDAACASAPDFARARDS